MKNENKALLIKYIVCFAIASLIAVLVFWSKGFFAHSLGVNISVLADGFSVSGILMTLFAGLMFVSGEGALIGIGFIVKSVILTFVPLGRKKHELYKDYRERKMKEMKEHRDGSIFHVGLLFLITGIVFNIIWYFNFYNVV